MAILEPLYRLDIVLDQRRSMWATLQEMAALYRSAIIYSNGKHKIISERDDLPVRQVFHSGNILREQTEVRIGGDPMQINQITGQFSNKNLDYERDILVVTDSQSVLIDNDAIKPYDLDLTGITRKTEINRRLSIEMQRRNEIKTEMSFTTNLQGIVVEPGDICIAGIITSDFELGYGGVALDGSTTTLIADRHVALNSGANHDLWVWHTAADTPELRTVTGVGSTEFVGLTPTAPFAFAVRAGDRWALAPQSEDLVKLLVKKVVHKESGLTQITGEQYTNVGYLLDCPGSLGSLGDFYNMPTNPWSITVIQSLCQVCFHLHFTAPSCIGGTVIKQLAANGVDVSAYMSVYPSTTTFPIPANVTSSDMNFVPGGFLADNTISFVSGPNSGLHRRILSWPRYDVLSKDTYMTVSPLPNLATIGDEFYITIDQGSNFGGFKLRWWIGADGFFNSMSVYQQVWGNSACFDFSNAADSVYIEVQPVSSLGAVSEAGNVYAVNIPGCFAQDERLSYNPGSVQVQSVTNLLALSLPATDLTPDQFYRVRAEGFLNDFCASGEATRVAFGVSYAGSTYINSYVVVMRDANSPGISIGSNAPFKLTSEIKLFSVPTSHIRLSFSFVGQAIGGSLVSTDYISSAITSINLFQVQSFAFTVLPFHADTAGAVHSHACFAVALAHGEFEIIDTLDD